MIYWLKNTNAALQTYHRLRVCQILKTFTDEDGVVNCWFVRRHLNPADHGSHNNSEPSDIGPDSTFFKGPEFIKQDLAVAEEQGLITQMQNMPGGLKSEDLPFYFDGLIHKTKPFTPEITFLEERISESINEAENNVSFVTSVPKIESSKKLFLLGGYITNPLTRDFRKTVLIHMIAFRFIIN